MKIDSPLFSSWKKLANQTFEWWQTDSEQTYQSNLIKNYKLLEKNNWLNSSISYNFNADGFRCKDFTDTDSIMFLGCSVTLGVGLSIDTIFPELISKSIQHSCVNLGIGGSSADTAFRLASIFLPKIKPKVVVATLIFPDRTELLTTDGALFFNPQSYQNKLNKEYFIHYYEKWMDRPEQSYLNHRKNLLAIHKLCDDLNIKFIDTYGLGVKQIKYSHRARDLVHPGIDYHQQVSDLILSKL